MGMLSICLYRFQILMQMADVADVMPSDSEEAEISDK
jgi:hypothetical protein